MTSRSSDDNNADGRAQGQGQLEIPPVMENVLRPHQIDALQFIWRRLVLEGVLRVAARTFSSTIEQRTRLYQEVTLMALKRERLRQQQCIKSGGAWSNVTPASANTAKGAHCTALRVLVLCPRSCVLHWLSSIQEWVQPRYAGGVQLNVYAPGASGITAASSRGGGRSLEDVIRAYYQDGGLLLLGYEEYQRLLQHAQTQYRTNAAHTWPRVWSLLDRIRQHLPLTQEVRLLDVLETADLIILDEAHRLRRSSSNLVTALTQHLRNVQLRLALTGTPLQNHLEEYNTMQSLVTGRELDTQLFHKHFIGPIELGQCVDSSYAQFQEMQRCVASLRNYFAHSAHRCGPEVLAATLPPRRDFLFFFRLSPVQEDAYKAMLRRFHKQLGSAEKSDSVLRLHHTASHIALHPALTELDGGTATANQHNANSGTVPSPFPSHAGHRDREEDGEEDGGDDAFASPASSPVLPASLLTCVDVADSPKLSFALHLTLYIVRQLREKVVIFSQYLSHLKLMGLLLAREGVQAPSLTGNASDTERRRWIDELQTDPACRVLLCSVRAGGVGIKLTAANHCILLDVSWNPADDTQATYRLYRYGQLKPVTIYRLATWGTSEHVVFAYALQKSWLQKKITDVSDPRRQQRHQTRSYFRYPCAIPLPDGVPTAPCGRDEQEQHRPTSHSSQETLLSQHRRSYALELCENECPPAARVLAEHPDAEEAFLYTVIPQAMLLRDNDDDATRERAQQLEEAAQRKRATLPIPLQLSPADTGRSQRHLQREDQSLLDTCEPELVDAARQAAHLILTHVLRLQATVEAQQTPHPNHLAHKHRGDTVSEVRTLDHALCQQLQPLLVARLGKRPAPRFLAEVLLWCFQAGAAQLAYTVLHGGAHLKLRTFLTSRISAASRHRPRDAPLPTRSPLEEALLFRPFSLLRAMSAVEVSYVSTELGCDRSLVGSCTLRGLQSLWWSTSGSAQLSSTSLQELAVLLGIRRAGEEAGPRDGGDADESACDVETSKDSSDADERYDTAEPVGEAVLQSLLGCLEEQWPPYEGLTLPPQHLQLSKEEERMERAYSAASRANVHGFLPMHEVAEILKLPVFRPSPPSYGCARCRHMLLQRSDAVHLVCTRCHYNAEFEIRADPRMQQHTVLYQLSVVANLLDAFSITQSFGTFFEPAGCADVSAALREVRSSQAVFEFVRHAMQEGVRVFLSEYPSVMVRLVGLQLGTGGDMETLERILCANGRLAAHANMREHVRQRLAQAFADFVHPSKLTQFAAMPLLFLVSALHYMARYEKLTYAHELLLEEYATPHRKLLRFAGDALVKVLYVERLLRHCKEKPQPLSTAAVPAPGAGNDGGSNGDISTAAWARTATMESRAVDGEDDAVSLTSLLLAASSSSSSGRSSPSPARGHLRRGNAPAKSPLSSPSSSSAPYAVSDSESESHHRVAPTSVTADVVRHPHYGMDDDGRASDDGSRTPSTPRSRSSSFRSLYSEDRASFPDSTDSEAERSHAVELAAPLDAAGTWLKALAHDQLAVPPPPTTEKLESEAVLQQRSAQYWIAFCEVYGTHSAETLTVYIEDGEGGVKALPAPSLTLWVSQVAHTTLVGLRMADMLDLFLRKLLDLSLQVRLIS